MLKPKIDTKLPWKTYGAIFAIWCVLMIPIASLVWGSGPSDVRAINNISTQETYVSPGLAKDFQLEAGAHGIWITTPEETNYSFSSNSFRVLSRSGQEVELFEPPGESIAIKNEQGVTYLAKVFRVKENGPYSLFLQESAPAETKARFGLAWEDGTVIDPESGLMALIGAWLVTIICAFMAFKATAKQRDEIIPSEKNDKNPA
jgi:hypothetical protein